MVLSKKEKMENESYKKVCQLNFGDGNWDIPVYRVYSINRLLELFIEKKNTLVRPQMWDDPFENVLFQQKARLISGGNVYFSELHRSVYGQCWTLNQYESDALWRIYSPDKNSVRVKTTLNKLFNSFYDSEQQGAYIKYFIGKIIYKTSKEIQTWFETPENIETIFLDSTGAGIVQTLLLKRTEFEHENEVRIIYSANPQSYNTSLNIYKYSIAPNDLLDELLFDPRFDENQFLVFKEYLKNMGYNKPILRSELYQTPKFNIQIL